MFQVNRDTNKKALEKKEGLLRFIENVKQERPDKHELLRTLSEVADFDFQLLIKSEEVNRIDELPSLLHDYNNIKF